MTTLLILVPLIGIILLNLPVQSFRRAGYWYALLISILQVWLIFQDRGIWTSSFDPMEEIFKFHLVADNMTLVMLLLIGLVTFLTLIVARSAISDDNKLFTFVNLMVIALTGMNGVVMATDVFAMYIFMEVTAVASFILIAFNKEKDGLEGAFKYIVLSAVASFLMLTAIGLLFMVSGDTTFTAIKQALSSQPNNGLILFATALFIGGLMIKGGLVPFHGWLPDAYSSAPAPVSVVLAGIVTKVSGIYIMMRLVIDVLGFNLAVKNVLLLVGALSILVGAIAALGQRDFKRMLAYSSISQVGYIVIGLGAGTDLGIAGAIFHLFNHTIFKSQLFINSAAVEEQAGTRDLDKMGGFAEKMPYTGLTSCIACLSTAGIPPLSGFWSKLIIIVALWKAGHIGFAVVAVLASLITLGYFLVLQRDIFFGKLAKGFENLKEASWGLVLPAVLLTLITVAVGFLFPFLINTIIIPMSNL